MLLTNHTYGRPFANVFMQYSIANSIPCMIVFSVFHSSRSKKAAANTFINELRQSRQRKYVTIRTCEVNTPHFHELIGSNCHGIIAGFNQILQSMTINRFASLINIHPSVLPNYRGPTPSYWCLKNRERHSGFTFHKVTETIDDGPILHQQSVEIGHCKSSDEIDSIISSLAIRVLVNYLDHLTQGAPFDHRRLDSSEVYDNSIGYLSFPPSTDQIL